MIIFFETMVKCLTILFIFMPRSSIAIDGVLFNLGAGINESLVQTQSTSGAKQVSAGIFWQTETHYQNSIIGYGELSIETYVSRISEKKNLNLLSVRPVITFWESDSKNRSWFWQAGWGLAYLDSKQFMGIPLSTHAQFSTLFGIGMLLDKEKKHQLAFRYNHYSNANIKYPNPGLDTISLDWMYRL